MCVGRSFLVSGHVQGVGFRCYAQNAARREGLSGHVTNHADGSVEVVAEGEAEAMTRFERALHQGPSRSRVVHVRVDEIVPAGLNAGFEIR